MFGLGATELIVIILAVVLLFGASRLPQLARSIGASKKAFKDGLREADDTGPTTTSTQQIRSAYTDDDLAAEMARRKGAQATSK